MSKGHWVRAAAQRMKASVRWRSGSRRMHEPTRNSPTSRLSLIAYETIEPRLTSSAMR